MSLSVTAIPPVTVRSPAAASPGRSPRQGNPETASSSASNSSTIDTGNRVAQETSALDRVLGHYRADLPQGEPAAALGSLARQVSTDAKLLAPTAALPKPAAATEASTAPKAEAASAQTGGSRLNTIL
jgi:hypothetical protein